LVLVKASKPLPFLTSIFSEIMSASEMAIWELMIAFLASSIRLDSPHRSFSPAPAEITFDASTSLDSVKDSDGDRYQAGSRGALSQHNQMHICSGASRLKLVGVGQADPTTDQSNVSGHLRSYRSSGVCQTEALA
jgi:hypothetical protein